MAVIRPPLEHRVPQHPDFHYYRASGGLWLWHATGFVGLFTRADLAIYFEEDR